MNVQLFTGLDQAVLSNLRNGAVANIHAPARREAIGAAYFWDYIAGGGDQLSHLTLGCALAYGSFIASQPEPVFDPPRQPVGNIAHFGDFGVADPLKATLRREAIILGGVRAGIASAYRLEYNDLHTTERTLGTVATIAANTFTFETTHTDAAGDLTRREAATLAFAQAPFTEEEQELYFAMAKLGMGVPPLVGSSLLENGHHYLTGSNKAFLALERQVIEGSSQPVRDQWQIAVDRSRDLAFHKACHPIANPLLYAFARNTELPLRLVRANLGSAAVRLPYIEPEIRASRAYLAVVNSVRTFGDTSGFRVDVPQLSLILDYVVSIPDGGPVPPAPDGVIQPADRDTGIRDLLAPAMARAAPAVAVAVGMYHSLVEESGGNPNTDSRLVAYSVRKLRGAYTADVAQGSSAIRNYRTFQRSAIERGQLATWTITDVGAVAEEAE